MVQGVNVEPQRAQMKQMVKVISHNAVSSPHTDGSVVFTRWRQYAPTPI